MNNNGDGGDEAKGLDAKLLRGRVRQRAASSQPPSDEQQRPKSVARREDRQSVSPTPLASRPTNWQVNSSRRCPRCFNLTCSCKEASRPDPETTRIRLEALRLNTPYERAKLMRSTEELRQDETRRRQKIFESMEYAARGLGAAELAARRLVIMQIQEEKCRRDLVKVEFREREARIASADGLVVQMALYAHEREGRRAIIATEVAAQHELCVQADFLRQIMVIFTREGNSRHTVEFHEGAQRGCLVTLDVNTRHRMLSNELAQRNFFDSFLQSRGHIVSAWQSETGTIQAIASAHELWIAERMAQRLGLYDRAAHSASEVVAEEIYARRRVESEREEEGHFVEERMRLFERQRIGFERTEGIARQGILEDAHSAWHNIFLEMKASEEEAIELEAIKRNRRESEVHHALLHLDSIAIEEAEAFEALASLELRERDQRCCWIESKLQARRSLYEQAATAKDAIAKQEGTARKDLLQWMDQVEITLQEQALVCERHIQGLLILATEEKASMEKAEHVARFTMISHMAEEEERVRRWCACKSHAVLTLEDEELRSRDQLERAVDLQLEELAWSFASTMDRLSTRARDYHNQLQELQDRSLSQKKGIVAEEEEHRRILTHQMEADHFKAANAECLRIQIELWQQEGRYRMTIVEEESSMWSDVQSRLTHSERCLREEAQRALQLQSAALMASERSARQLFILTVEEAYQLLYAAEREEAAVAIAAAEEHILEELRKREQRMAEDVRMYDDTEALPFPEDSGMVSSCRHPHMLFSNADANSSTAPLRQELALQALGNPPLVAAPSAEAVDLIVYVVDTLSSRSAAAKEAMQRAERAHHSAAQRLARQEAVLLGEREKRDAYHAKLSRDAEDRERRIQMDKLDKQRGVQQLDIDRKRLDDTLATLANKREQLEMLKGSLNKQLGGHHQGSY